MENEDAVQKIICETARFVKKFEEIMNKTHKFSEKARQQGLLALEDFLDEEKANRKDVFVLGIRLIVDGTETAVVDKILSNLVNLETDVDEKLLKTIQKEAVLGIQKRINFRLLSLILHSYVDSGMEDTINCYWGTS